MSDETNQSHDAESDARAYGDALKQSLDQLRAEVDARLTRSREELGRLIGEFEASLPELPSPPEPAPAPVPVELSHDSDPDAPTIDEVAASLLEIEGADSQPELLARLVEQASLFASRTLLLLPASGDTLRCWASLGFGGAGTMLENLDLSRPQIVAWSAFESGARELDSEHCRALTDAVSVDAPARGSLIPLEVRGQVLAILYADQLGEDRFSMPALQLLTYGTARGLDTLGAGGPAAPAALRRVTLDEIAAAVEAAAPVATQDVVVSEEVVAEDVSVEEERSDVAESFAEPPSVETVVAAPADLESELESTPPEPAQTEVGTAELTITPPDSEPPAAESPSAAPSFEVPPAPPETPSSLPETPAASEAASTEVFGETTTPVDPEPEVAETPEGARAAGFTMDSGKPGPHEPNFQVVDAQAPVTPPSSPPAPPAPPVFTDDDPLATTEELTASRLPDAGAEPPSQSPPPPPPIAPPPAFEPEVDETPTVEDTWELASEEPEDLAPPAAPPPPAAPAPPAESAEALATQVIHHDQVEAMINAGKPAAAVEPPPPSGGQVAPPADLQGPGSAFADRTAPDDPAHDEARRLARLLVSEIKLYNEEAIEEGKKEGNIYARLREDIDRSRHMYEERVEATVRATSDYFKDELVRTLAGGDAAVMGL